MSPLEAAALDNSTDIGRLARDGKITLQRVNHADLRTVYPPVAQIAFALANHVKPWSLTAWRCVLLVLDAATLALILALLCAVGRSPLWAAMYWWNPVVLKEVFNSGHMEPVVLAPVLAALLLAIRGWQIAALFMLGLATSAKLWPALLLPLLIRGGRFNPSRSAAGCLAFALAVVPSAAWLIAAGPQAGTGFAAYAEAWQTNSALFPALKQAIATGFQMSIEHAGLAARVTIAFALAGWALAMSVKPIDHGEDLLHRASLLIGALVLLAPSQYPWYTIWFAPFLVFRPWPCFLLLTVTIQLYYTFFYFAAHDAAATFNSTIVWIIWVPVWVVLFRDATAARAADRNA